MGRNAKEFGCFFAPTSPYCLALRTRTLTFCQVTSLYIEVYRPDGSTIHLSPSWAGDGALKVLPYMLCFRGAGQVHEVARRGSTPLLWPITIYQQHLS